MRQYWKLNFIHFVILVVSSGCANTNRGMLEDNIYYSSQSPNVQIKIRVDFEYTRGATGEYQHQFFDNEGHRLIYIRYWANNLNENKVDYYEHPDHWIYDKFPDSSEIERFEMDMAGEKWYVRDAVSHVSTASCFMFRDLGVFTDMQDVLKLIYFWEMPPYMCKEWKSTDSLSDSQQQYLKEFRDGFTEDIKITEYIPVYAEDGKKRLPFDTGTVHKEHLSEPITGMEFIYVKGGCYQMGDTFVDEKPVHEICVDGFYMGKYEVTQGEYTKIIGRNPSHFKKGDQYPVEKVSWSDAQSFIEKLNSRSGKTFRLPTEAEWEYAARSGGKREKHSGGNRPSPVAWYERNSGKSTHPVGTKSPNGLGLHDLSGNVYEWCFDWYEANYYSSSPVNNPQGPSMGSDRVIRGGCWNSGPWDTRSAFRFSVRPENRNFNLGFRLVFSEGK